MQGVLARLVLALCFTACQTPSSDVEQAVTADDAFVCPVSVSDAVVAQLCETEQIYLFEAESETMDRSLQAMGLPPVLDRRERPTPLSLGSFAQAMELCSRLQDAAQDTPEGGPGCELLQLADEVPCKVLPCEKLTVAPPPSRGSPAWLAGMDLENSAAHLLEQLDDGNPRVACAKGSNRIVCDILEQIDAFDPDGRFGIEIVPHLDVIPQHSIIATLPAKDVTATDHILIGAHVDSWIGSPGVEDNLSGVVAAMTMMKAIVQHGLEFDSKLNFAFYAGEEGGLIGSCRIRTMFEENALLSSMRAALNFDMVGRGPVPRIIYIAEPGSEGYDWQTLDVQAIAERHFKPADIEVKSYPKAPSSDNVTWGTACRPVASFRKLALCESGPWYHKAEDTTTVAKSLDRMARLALVVIWEIA